MIKFYTFSLQFFSSELKESVLSLIYVQLLKIIASFNFNYEILKTLKKDLFWFVLILPLA
jgi:hypothetical protein